MIASREFVVKKMTELLANPKKKYSQNFLVDKDVVLDSVNSLSEDVSDIYEIGPGLGALSEQILDKGYNLTAFEIDRVMIEHLKNYFSRRNNFNLIEGDFLKQNLEFLSDKTFDFISNIPYSITTPLIEKVLLTKGNIKRFVFMLQKEAGQRISSKIGQKDYGPLPIFITYVGELSIIRKVTRDKFLPSPNVDSIVMKIIFNNDRDFEKERKLYSLLNASFKMRRKTIYNNLCAYLPNKNIVQELLLKSNIDQNKRPEQLTLDDYLRILENL